MIYTYKSRNNNLGNDSQFVGPPKSPLAAHHNPEKRFKIYYPDVCSQLPGTRSNINQYNIFEPLFHYYIQRKIKI